MADVTITALDNGPYMVKGGVELKDGAGNTYEVKETVYLCRCGQSKSKPFCDGSHKAAGFQNEARA